MKAKAFLLKGFVVAGIVYALGYWLTQIYGFDPPYIYQWVGIAFQLALAPVIVIATLTKAVLIHKKDNSK